MEATRSAEKSVYNKPTRRLIPEDGILQFHTRLPSEFIRIYAFLSREASSSDFTSWNGGKIF
jgi:hypothetical protein